MCVIRNGPLRSFARLILHPPSAPDVRMRPCTFYIGDGLAESNQRFGTIKRYYGLWHALLFLLLLRYFSSVFIILYLYNILL